MAKHGAIMYYFGHALLPVERHDHLPSVSDLPFLVSVSLSVYIKLGLSVNFLKKYLNILWSSYISRLYM